MPQTQTIKNNTFRPIHYLGSKLRILDFINDTLDNLDPMQGTVCDLFSGSGTVSKFLSKNRRVVSVDIQEYSRVLCSALLNPSNLEMSAHDFIDSVASSDNYKKLRNVFSSLIRYEAEALDDARKGYINSLYEIIEYGSLLKIEQAELSEINKYSPTFFSVLNETVAQIKKNGFDNNAKAMVARYFGGLYFSYEQAIQIDSALEVAFQISENGSSQRDILIAAILSATSDIVNTVGKQFAQPLQVRDGKGKLKINLLPKILNDRSMQFYERLLYWITQYVQINPSASKHEIIRADYREALKKLQGGKVSIIYADPPYTRYHYSRYYHVLETICLRDTPEVSSTFANKSGISRGVYRKDRHQSPFCIKTQAPEAFNELFNYASKVNAPLVLSYSPFNNNQPATPRMQSVENLVEQARTFYKYVDLLSPGYFTHSKLNETSKNFGIDTEAELLLVCKM